MTRNRLFARVSNIGIAFVLALLLDGCATGGKLTAPKLTIVGAGMMSPDVFSEQFRVRIHVDNPNDRELPVKSIEYKLFLEGDSFAEGTSTAPFVVPAKGQTEFDMTVKTNFSSSIGRLLSHLAGTTRREIQYNLEGSVAIDGVFGKIKFNEIGKVDLAKL